MRILAFSVADYEEAAFLRLEKQYGVEITCRKEELTEETMNLVSGEYDGVTFLGHSKITRKVLMKLKEEGICHIATRTIGFDHIDLEAAKELGIHVSNARYEPYNVADFTVMLMLMLMRKAKISICRALVNDFSLDSLKGREMRSMTVGIIGTGRIGALTIKNLSGFGCRILANDKRVNKSVEGLAEYVDIDTIYRECDIISLHMPITDENYHMINKETISKMKDGVILINTARGALIDSDDLVEGLESGKVGAAGIDSIEGEEGVAHVCIGTEIIDKRNLLYLKQFPNVILTQHYGFFTEEATSEMVRCAVVSLLYFYEGKENPYQVV